MTPPPSLTTVTSTALLEGLQDAGNQTLWRDYVDRYRPLLVGYARRLGLAGADAEDIAQDALLAFAQEYRAGKYDRARGRLRSWLFGIARTTLKNWQRRAYHDRQRRADPGSLSELEELRDDGELERLWEEEWQKAIVRQCMQEVERELEHKTFEAFRLFACEGLAAKDVAEQLGVTTNAVWIAKHRVLRRMRELHPTIEELW